MTRPRIREYTCQCCRNGASTTVGSWAERFGFCGYCAIHPERNYDAFKESELRMTEADFSSMSHPRAVIVGEDKLGPVYRIVVAGADGSLGIEGRDVKKLTQAIWQAEGHDQQIPGDAALSAATEKVQHLIRIGDTERDDTVSKLSMHFQAGRIRQDEFDERSAKALSATSQPELDELLTDLPHITSHEVTEMNPEHFAMMKDLALETQQAQHKLHLNRQLAFMFLMWAIMATVAVVAFHL